jgi:hypothetical protein
MALYRIVYLARQRYLPLPVSYRVLRSLRVLRATPFSCFPKAFNLRDAGRRTLSAERGT